MLKLRFQVAVILILEMEFVVLMETKETNKVLSAARNRVGVELHQLIAVGVAVELVVMETEETEETEFLRTDSVALNGDGAELHLLIAVTNVAYVEMRLYLIIGIVKSKYCSCIREEILQKRIYICSSFS